MPIPHSKSHASRSPEAQTSPQTVTIFQKHSSSFRWDLFTHIFLSVYHVCRALNKEHGRPAPYPSSAPSLTGIHP